MEETLHALRGILLQAVPTFFLVILLYVFLRSAFFRPLERVLRERFEATDGARQRAAETVARAEAKAQEYEAALRAARAEIYQAQEDLHRTWEEERKSQMVVARASAEESIRKAKEELAAEVVQAKKDLERESDILAEKISEVVLGRGVA